MGLRETINSSKTSGIVITLVLVLLAGGIMLWTSSDSTAPLSSAFFTDDDGKTFFKDDIRKATPFKHDGKDAVRAFVFNVGGTKKVLLLERYTQAALPKAQALLSKNDGSPQALADLTAFRQEDVTEVKKPGDPDWVLSNSNKGNGLRSTAGAGAPAVYP